MNLLSIGNLGDQATLRRGCEPMGEKSYRSYDMKHPYSIPSWFSVCFQGQRSTSRPMKRLLQWRSNIDAQTCKMRNMVHLLLYSISRLKFQGCNTIVCFSCEHILLARTVRDFFILQASRTPCLAGRYKERCLSRRPW